MLVTSILDNINKVNALATKYLQIFPLIAKEKRIYSLYSPEYKDLASESNFETQRGQQFLDDLTDFLLYTSGFDVVLFNVPVSAKLKYGNEEEDVITPEHIYDTLLEIDDTTRFGANVIPGVYAFSCSKSDYVSELLDGKMMGGNVLKVRSLKDKGKFKFVSPRSEKEDLCSSAIVVSFFISLALLFALDFFFSS